MTRTGVGLIRVSKARNREDLISPDLQRTAISSYSSRVGISIVGWREALDESGSQARSPWWTTLDAIISEVEAGDFQAVVAWKFNRAARHRLRWAVALDRIEAAGATLESATEGVDTTTSTGRFTRGMLAEIAAFEAERIGEVWKEVKARRTSLGLTGDGQPRFGYTITAGRYVPDENAALLRSAYEQAVAGVSLRAITDRLNSLGARTKYGNPYTPWHLGLLLRNGFAAGLIRTGGAWQPGAHEPIISPALWEAFTALPTTTPGSRYGHHTLSGLLRCAYCHRPLHAAHRAGHPLGVYWRCPRAVPDCPGTYGWAPRVNRMLDTWLREILNGEDPAFQAALNARPVKQSPSKQRRLLKIETDLLTIARKNNNGFYDDETYLRLRAELKDEQRILTKQLDETTSVAPTLHLIASVLTVDEGADRNTALRRVLEHVLVRNGARDKELDKYLIVPRWPVVRR